MARKKGGLFKIRAPRLRLTSKGVKLSGPTARVGGKIGLNLSRKGVSGSVRTSLGTASTRKGRSTGFFGLGKTLSQGSRMRIPKGKSAKVAKSCCATTLLLVLGFLALGSLLVVRLSSWAANAAITKRESSSC